MDAKLFLLALLFPPSLAMAGEDFEKCFDDLAANIELVPISVKMAIAGTEKASFEQTANQEKPSDSEKPLIAKYAKGVKTCADLRLNAQPANTHHEVIAAMEDHELVRASDLADLFNRKISYGEYILRRQAAWVKTKHRFEAADRDIAEQNARIEEENAQAAARQRAVERQRNIDMLQGISNGIRSATPPPIVNCDPNGLGGVRCQ